MELEMLYGLQMLPLVIGSTILLTGIVFLLVGMSQSKYTGRVMGTITGTAVNTLDYNMGGTGQRYHRTKSRKPGFYVSGSRIRRREGAEVLTYEYEVNGVQYRRATSVAYGKGQARRMIGQTKLIRYDEKNPAKSTTVSGTVYKVICGILIPLGLLVDIVTLIYLYMQIG